MTHDYEKDNELLKAIYEEGNYGYWVNWLELSKDKRESIWRLDESGRIEKTLVRIQRVPEYRVILRLSRSGLESLIDQAKIQPRPVTKKKAKKKTGGK